MNKKIAIPIITAIIIASAISASYYYQKPSDDNFSNWVVSGPFAIDKSKYKLGEDVFVTVHGLKPNEVGNMVILLPDGRIWETIPFNGTAKSQFNNYFKPDTAGVRGIYEPLELVGTWKVMFEGVPYEPITFEFVNEYIYGADKDIVSIPRKNSTG